MKTSQNPSELRFVIVDWDDREVYSNLTRTEVENKLTSWHEEGYEILDRDGFEVYAYGNPCAIPFKSAGVVLDLDFE